MAAHPARRGGILLASGYNPNNNTILGGDSTGHTHDAGSDPASAVDSQGRAYFSCVTFDVASNASGLYVTQAPQGGRSYFNIPDIPNKRFMVVDGALADDPQLLHQDGVLAWYVSRPVRTPQEIIDALMTRLPASTNSRPALALIREPELAFAGCHGETSAMIGLLGR